jgi:hypothetical protein
MEPRRASAVKAASEQPLAQPRILGMTFGRIGAEFPATFNLDEGHIPLPDSVWVRGPTLGPFLWMFFLDYP